LFDESEMPIPSAPRERDETPQTGVACAMAAQRDQIELRACDLDALLGGEHAARTVWAFVQSLDLGRLPKTPGSAPSHGSTSGFAPRRDDDRRGGEGSAAGVICRAAVPRGTPADPRRGA